jgi:hypothetical protein
MKPIQPVLVTMGLILLLGPGCRSREKRKGAYDVDGGVVIREECNVPASKCFRSCLAREASLGCTGCCRDQSFLCDTGQKHSFEYCDGAQ